MNLFFVNKDNPYKRRGTWVVRYDDGYEEVTLMSPNGRAKIDQHVGLLYPHEVLGPFLQKVESNGLDSGAARQDRIRLDGH